MSFYRTYRPQVIDEIDNPIVRDQFLSFVTVDKKKLPHAFLFVGPRGAGKTTAARLFAKLVNCEKPTKKGPCGTCDQCISIAKNTHLDVIEIDAASNRGIDEIRLLKERIGLSPSGSSHTVYIIDEVHMLTTEAFNALLKTLEEPPLHVFFVLATTEQQKVPATIQSRCMVIPFHKASEQEIVQSLTRIINREKISIEETAISLIAQKTDGSFRDAVKMLEQAFLLGEKITSLTIEKLSSGVSEAKLLGFLAYVTAKDEKNAFSLLQSWKDGGTDMKQCMFECIVLLEKELINSTTETDKKIQQPAVVKLLRLFIKNTELLRFSPLPSIPLELTVAEYCQEDTEVPVIEAKNIHTHVHIDSKQIVDDVPKQSTNGLLSLDKLQEHWKDFIITIGKTNHSVAGVLRSTRPKTVEGDIVTIEAFYSFHKDKLSEPHAKEVMASAIKTLFGEKVTIHIDLGSKK